MKLSILPIRSLSGAKIPFAYSLDLSDLALFGERPIPDGVEVSGFVEHRADLFALHMRLHYTVHTVCARFLKPLALAQQLEFTRILVDQAENEEELDEQTLVLPQPDTVDLDEVAREAIIFNTQMRYVCSPDCKGLCPRCGQDLNEGPCNCGPEPDERFAALADLLKEQD